MAEPLWNLQALKLIVDKQTNVNKRLDDEILQLKQLPYEDSDYSTNMLQKYENS